MTFFGRSRLERRFVLVIALLHVAIAVGAELVPVMRSVHQGQTYTVRRGYQFFMNMLPLFGPIAVFSGWRHTLTVESESGATCVDMFDALEDIYWKHPFLEADARRGPK